jgi:hypothetical protein
LNNSLTKPETAALRFNSANDALHHLDEDELVESGPRLFSFRSLDFVKHHEELEIEPAVELCPRSKGVELHLILRAAPDEGSGMLMSPPIPQSIATCRHESPDLAIAKGSGAFWPFDLFEMSWSRRTRVAMQILQNN